MSSTRTVRQRSGIAMLRSAEHHSAHCVQCTTNPGFQLACGIKLALCMLLKEGPAMCVPMVHQGYAANNSQRSDLNEEYVYSAKTTWQIMGQWPKKINMWLNGPVAAKWIGACG